MHIGLICSEYPPVPHGGIGSFLRDLAEGLAGAGHSVTVAGIYRDLSEGNEENLNGVRVLRIPCAPGFLGYRCGAWYDRARLYGRLSREHRLQPFDLIECPDYAGWLPFGAPRGIPMIVRFHGANFFFDAELGRKGNAFEHGLERKTIRRADFLTSPSRYAAERTVKLAGKGERPVTVIPHAVDADLFQPGAGKPEEGGLIVFANSVNPKKGVEELCDAMNLVCREMPGAHLVFAGADTHPHGSGRPYSEALLERVDSPFRKKIRFAGWLDRTTGVLPLLQRAQVCCYPSRMETLGIAPLEAMACGKAVVYSRTGPGPEVIEDGVSGLLCDPMEPEEIAGCLLRLLKDAALRAKLGGNARARVLERFNKKRWIPENIAFYESCAQAKRGGITREP